MLDWKGGGIKRGGGEVIMEIGGERKVDDGGVKGDGVGKDGKGEGGVGARGE